MCTEKKYLKNFVICTYFFAIISSLLIYAVSLNRSSFRAVLVISTGSFTVLSSVILRSFFVLSSVRLCLLFLFFYAPSFVQVVSSIRTVFFAIHINCLLFIIILLFIMKANLSTKMCFLQCYMEPPNHSGSIALRLACQPMRYH